ncbi:hypothetical protein NYZ99_17220 [Maribacter litopenaei]|uniref:Ankyrin repeat-containing protein n=1 Tax=Maribacter litopenaei TaxID=2976127 RepID=A0ABY5Y6E8_9FLAO|nr:hypothetical protein [Maribacter litopenaei]UWX54595.1 hypothetical protein NYZ99_17220 [Maribacter litopenaei]
MNRRVALKTYSLSLLGLTLPGLSMSKEPFVKQQELSKSLDIPKHYPNIPPEIISEVVGKSHSDLERVKQLVDKRPELSRSVWEWRFGDFESAIGAASHVGRRDIAQYLMEKGARATLFTFAMLGHINVVKASIEANPGIEKTMGPHGISLLDHAYAGERMKNEMSNTEIENLERTIDYLANLGNAGGDSYIEVTPEEQQKYIGDYKYGDGEKEGFTVGVNMRKLLSLGPIGGFGGGLYKTGENTFIYNGTPSVTISFETENNAVTSLKITDPEVTVIAKKI